MCSFLYLIFSLLFLLRVNCFDDPNIIIIGAGAAGIAAATKLYQNGFENITILEAENRIGGRIYSLQFGEVYIDLGAQWCHGQKNNVVYGMVKDLNILNDDKISPRLYHSKRKLIDEKFSLKLIEMFETLYGDVNIDERGSLGEYLIKQYNETIRKTWKNDKDKLALAEDCLDVFQKWVETYESSFSWFDVAASSDYVESEGNLALGWNEFGFKTILDVMMQKFPDSKAPIPIDDRIILNKEVEKVLWSSTDRTEIKCADGTSYSCDHVIWTPSLGVLKHGYKTLFEPQVPIEKVTAIEVLGMDATLKTILHFPKRWWNDDFEGIFFAWDPTDLQKSADAFLEGPKKEGKSWITSVLCIIPVQKSPNLLSAWFGGEFVPEIEKSSDETIINGIVYTLQTFLAGIYPNISLPDKVMRKNWYTDSHFRGAYSFETVESRKLNNPQGEIISKPLLSKDGKPILLFAGEATNPVHHSTVHGAIESGFREADRLIQFYKHSK